MVGSINADLTVTVQRHPQPGETLLGSGGTISPGGKGANQALAAARRGATVQMVGAVGRDAYAEPALALLKAEGLDLNHIEHVDDPTGLAVITVSVDGENTIVVIPGANAAVTPALVDAHAETIRSSSVVLLQGELPRAAIERAIELAIEAEVRPVVNLAPVIEIDTDLLRAADPIIANEHEAGLILQLFRRNPGSTPEELVEQLLECGFRSVVLTLGAAGAMVAAADITPTRVASPSVRAVDTTGCGDAFAGACVAALDTGASLIESATLGCRVGAYAATAAGAQTSYPGRDAELPL